MLYKQALSILARYLRAAYGLAAHLRKTMKTESDTGVTRGEVVNPKPDNLKV